MRALMTLLADGQPHSTWEITRQLRLCDTTLIRELRSHGYEIPCRHTGTHGVYQYSTADLERHIAHEHARLEAERARLDTIRASVVAN